MRCATLLAVDNEPRCASRYPRHASCPCWPIQVCTWAASPAWRVCAQGRRTERAQRARQSSQREQGTDHTHCHGPGTRPSTARSARHRAWRLWMKPAPHLGRAMREWVQQRSPPQRPGSGHLGRTPQDVHPSQRTPPKTVVGIHSRLDCHRSVTINPERNAVAQSDSGSVQPIQIKVA